jgi:hypothetical protein
MKRPFLLIRLVLACFSLPREVMANTAATAPAPTTAREDAEANAADEPIDSTTDNFIKIAPFGTYPGSKPGRPQHFYETEANAMIAEFGSLRGKAGRLFRGIPIFIGHPDQKPELYTDHRRLGKVTNLETRQDGLYGEVQWNALGEENKREGYWVYPSPRWDAPAGRQEFRPDRLISIGLTNMPRIATSEPVTNSADPEPMPDPAATSQEPTTETTNETTDMDRKLLTEKLGLDVTATDEEILAKLADLMSAADTAATKTQEAETAKTEMETAANSLADANTRITALEREAQTAREAEANARLDLAEREGRITKAERSEWLPRLTGDKRETEANALGALKPKLNTAPIDVIHQRVEIGDEKGRRETIANAVEAYERKGMTYDEAWNAAKKDPELKAVWEAMDKQG